LNALETHALELLKRDTLDEAEKIVGPGDDATKLGIVMMQQLAQEKEDALSVLGDTHFSMSYAGAQQLFERNGFDKVYHETHNYAEDVFEIWWHPAGLLLTSESFEMNHRFVVNKIQVYYNWVPTSLDGAYQYTSSGEYEEMADGTMVWAGYYDGREGLLTHLKQLREHGHFLANWFHQPFLWLLNYEEPKVEGYDYKAINMLKYVVLPARVQQAIGPIG
jgi:hypothetical protein